MEIPKYCAVCVDDDEFVGHCGVGDTPDEALSEFMSNGEFEDQCEDWIVAPGDCVEVHIYTVVSVENSDWPKDEAQPDWQWCLHNKLETRTVEAV